MNSRLLNCRLTLRWWPLVQVWTLLPIAFLLLPPFFAESIAQEKSDQAENVSYYKQIRPIFQMKCFGCHQGAKQGGQYVMTEFTKMLAGGETGAKAIVPGHPDKSYLMELIVPEDDEAEMPRDQEPLGGSEIELIRKWIEQGAKDDTPAHANVLFSDKNPPHYTLLPTVSALDVSPDGKQIAVAGFHEVVIHSMTWDQKTGQFSNKMIARLIGLSERIESVQFSPDGKQLVACGGSPGRMGEVQVWNLANRKLSLSKQVGYDTLYGASWSGDGKLISFGCPDSTIRAIDAKSGEQVLFNGAHNDWVLDTVFSTKNDHLITVSRDMSMKLVKVDTQRFIDNITSITPGALKGGLNAVDCHPKKDELLAAGADGVPRVYRMLRNKARKIGDDFNLLKAYGKLDGRVFDACFSGDGKWIAAVSSINGKGQAKIFETESGKEVAKFDHAKGGLFTVDFLPQNGSIAFCGFDGIIRIMDRNGKNIGEFNAVPLKDSKPSKPE